MTRPPSGIRVLEPLADTRRRIRSTTWLAAGTATAASALFGVVFAQPDPTAAVAAAAAAPVPIPVAAPAVSPAPARNSHSAPHRSTVHHRVLRTSAPLQPPLQPPSRGSAHGGATSGAS